jgi:pimeloyl-ACP methyl ester carboxylesterase/UDP:flavonoid glycosyltransferase YjiC (YdhE family)
MYVYRPDAKIFYQVTGSGTRDVFLSPPAQPTVHSRMWKYQVPYLSRYFRVVTMDMRGNGRSDRPASGYDLPTRYADFVAVLDAATRPGFALVAFACSGLLALRYVVEHPDRVSRLVLVGGQYAESMPQPFEERVARVIREDFDGWRTRLYKRILPEPHSLKGVEDGVAWAGETTAEVLIESLRAIDGESVHDLLPQVRVPTLAIHGTQDRIVPYGHAQKLAAAIPGCRLVTVEGGGHLLPGRDSVKVNRIIRDFVLERPVESHVVPATTERTTSPPRPRRGSERRVLWLSSPVGLGHIQRDIAIARALRDLRPGTTVDFLTANPADRVVAHHGERLHPASALLLNESAHVEGWAGDHELHVFNALWDMDEIMAANFMTLADVVERTPYDLWVGDEGWDLDYYLHENPDLKAAPYVFLTDFVGFVPMRDDAHSTESARVWEKNAENIDHLRLHPDVRDLSIMVGEAEDVLDREFGPGLPNMRAWAREHFQFSRYTYHFDPAAFRDKAALRRQLGFREGERVVLVSVGGTRVGRHLLRKCAEAFRLIADRVPDTRMLLVTGPRGLEDDVPAGPRVETRTFVPDLFRHHAAADLAIVQGGLTTTMELAALRTPFLYFPLRNHFEQQFFVARRLERLGAGVRMDYDRTTVEALAQAILDHLAKPVHWSDVPADGTARAARSIAELL